VDIVAVVPGFVPDPVGQGEYYDEITNTQVYFYLQKYHDMDLKSVPDPAELASLIAELHEKGQSPNGMFGYHVPTGGGILVRTVTWEKSWATQFTHQLKDVIKLDNEANDPWLEYDAACKQIIDHVIPRLLGILQSDGREITPSLVHLDIWEGNVATDLETGRIITFDAGCCYAHNEIEFGTWRCSWATHFKSPIYQMLYQREIEPSEPVEEWDDRNRLYAIRAALTDSAGHPGSSSRAM
jgi:protein-ribulosamine 3-kinase